MNMTPINRNTFSPAVAPQDTSVPVTPQESQQKTNSPLKVTVRDQPANVTFQDEISTEIELDATNRNDHLGDLIRQALSYSCPPMPTFPK
ncbi:MAG: hypothetical protein IJJ26_09035 [Victivallales bacterium]|nr:hypothetical protein [Victivallales bacterium]